MSAFVKDAAAFSAGLALATSLFEEVGAAGFDGLGQTRAPFGPAEQAAHDIVARHARGLNLEVSVDAALNLTVTLPGSDRTRPRIVVGSHLDSVACGGNFDGLAGVAAGIACLAWMAAAGAQPACDVSVVALRGEENYWFGARHVGSRAVLGLLGERDLATARRVDSGRTLGEHMAEAGADLAAIAAGRPLIDRGRVRCFLECHIEQGPVLVERKLPLGIVTGIRGNRRCREAVCKGRYGHSGAEPRRLRRDAVLAAAEFCSRVEREWIALETGGEDLVVTFGRFFTDPAAHGVTVIPGRVTFSIDVRSHSQATLRRIWRRIEETAEAAACARGVSFEFGPVAQDDPVAMDPTLRRTLAEGCGALGIPEFHLACGAGHDAADFASAGVPTAMILIRNENGSHNPDEAMDMDDFSAAVRLLGWTIGRIAGEGAGRQ